MRDSRAEVSLPSRGLRASVLPLNKQPLLFC